MARQTQVFAVTTSLVLIAIGRVLIGALFVIAAIQNLINLKQRVTIPTNYGFVLPPPVTVLGFAVQLLGGLSVVLGIYPAWGAAALIVFLVLATGLFHNALLFKKPERDNHVYLVTVNTALAGAMLLIIALG
ncbi:hypothetical protein WH87_08990 [Devosia epidermidihirudinis]|uniref:DoxX family protein n=1 Tax=Devosia epidermidihirudinis TaxID=1293439 RepID=A0A0F5QA28_9HYPH|nr:hypothetical protein WH87_08990 [Devosia epidermidihirudinis]